MAVLENNYIHNPQSKLLHDFAYILKRIKDLQLLFNFFTGVSKDKGKK